MAEENQVYPLAPARIHRRSDEEFAIVKSGNPRRHRSGKCFVYILTVIVFQCIAILAFAPAILRVKSPEFKLSSAAMKNLSYITSPLPYLNFTMVAEISVNNKNFGRFRFENSNATVWYENVMVGGAKINRGRAKARETERLIVRVEGRSNGWLTENQDFISDVNSGLVRLRSYAKLIGRVRVMKIIDKRKSTEMNCTMSFNLWTKAIQDLRCM